MASDPLSNFPKERIPLPTEYEAIYLRHYRNSREGNSQILSLAQRAERWMHRQVARDVRATPAKATLELGAGTLNQLPYEPLTAPYDIVEPFRELYETSADLGRIRRVYSDISELPLEPQYDRVTSIAVLEHVTNLPELVARSALLL
ncbi:MAG TPA: class I SAM-dependent methyltransferase, partial [Verrucomicrobiae bacterium]|nr:class I SAM-dependent methyltransferase [Verrucomicrobiae bacterium]